MAHAAVVTELKGENSDLQKKIDESESSIEGFGKSVEGAFAGGAAAGAGFGVAMAAVSAAIEVVQAAIEAVVDQLAEWGEGYMKQELVEKRLAAAIEATGGAAGFTLDQMKQLADQLAATTLFEDDVALGAANILTQFKNIRGDIFKDALTMAANMAEETGDLAGAARELGRSLNDPERGMQLLERASKGLSDEQKENIARMVELGDVAGAQRVILDELATLHGDKAAGAVDTLSGSLTQLTKRFGEAGEEVFKGLLPAMKIIEPIINGAITAFENLAPMIEPVVEAIVEFGHSVFKELQPALDWIKDTAIERFTALQVAVETMWGVAKSVFEEFGPIVADAMGTAWEWFTKTEDVITSLIVNGVVMAKTAIEEWATVWDLAVTQGALSLTSFTEDVIHLFGTVVPDTLKWFGENFTKILTDVNNFTGTVFVNMAKNVKAFLAGLATGDFTFTKLTDGFKATMDEFPGIAQRAMTDTERTLQGDVDVLNERVGNAFEKNRKAFEDQLAANKQALDDLFKRPDGEVEDPQDNASDKFDDPKKKQDELKPKKEKVERDVKEDRTVKEKVDREVNEKRIGGVMEDLESLHDRISTAAAGVQADATLADVQGAVNNVQAAVNQIPGAINALPAGIAAALPQGGGVGAGGVPGPPGGGPPPGPAVPPGAPAPPVPGPVVPAPGGNQLGPDGAPLDLPIGKEEEEEARTRRERRERRVRDARSKADNRPFEEPEGREDQRERIADGQQRAREKAEADRERRAAAEQRNRDLVDARNQAAKDRIAAGQRKAREAEQARLDKARGTEDEQEGLANEPEKPQEPLEVAEAPEQGERPQVPQKGLGERDGADQPMAGEDQQPAEPPRVATELGIPEPTGHVETEPEAPAIAAEPPKFQMPPSPFWDLAAAGDSGEQAEAPEPQLETPDEPKPKRRSRLDDPDDPVFGIDPADQAGIQWPEFPDIKFETPTFPEPQAAETAQTQQQFDDTRLASLLEKLLNVMDRTHGITSAQKDRIDRLADQIPSLGTLT